MSAPGYAIDDQTAIKVIDGAVEVVSEGRGYYASSTMSGTRVNSKLEDLAASITVMTKEQMSDFGMLDINDVFLYTAGTEGTGDYTDFAVNNSGNVADNIQDRLYETNPQTGEITVYKIPHLPGDAPGGLLARRLQTFPRHDSTSNAHSLAESARDGHIFITPSGNCMNFFIMSYGDSLMPM